MLKRSLGIGLVVTALLVGLGGIRFFEWREEGITEGDIHRFAAFGIFRGVFNGPDRPKKVVMEKMTVDRRKRSFVAQIRMSRFDFRVGGVTIEGVSGDFVGEYKGKVDVEARPFANPLKIPLTRLAVTGAHPQIEPPPLIQEGALEKCWGERQTANQLFDAYVSLANSANPLPEDQAMVIYVFAMRHLRRAGDFKAAQELGEFDLSLPREWDARLRQERQLTAAHSRV